VPPVRIVAAAVDRLAARLKDLNPPAPSDFVYSEETPWFPPLGAAWAPAFFFNTALHLYGLWHEDGRRFTGPVRGYVDGREYVGEDFLWKAAWRSAQEEPKSLLPSFQANMDAALFARLFRTDAGDCPIPLVKSHAELARAWGAALEEGKLTPKKVLDEAAEDPVPLRRFVARLADLPGYREDKLQRKTFLLALILSSRPERFLDARGAEWPPLPDRHALRLALRWGALEVADDGVRRALEQGLVAPPPVEEALRAAAYEVFREALVRSGRTVPGTYRLFYDARDYCPDTSEPDCPRCRFFAACDRRTALRQPATRTTHY
jgi:hypothetical protein